MHNLKSAGGHSVVWSPNTGQPGPLSGERGVPVVCVSP